MLVRFLFVCLLFFSAQGHSADGSGLGLHAGTGIPFLGQAGLTYMMSSQTVFHFNYNILDVDVGTASVDLTMPEVSVQYFPWAEAFFVGVGIGQESLKVSSTDITTGLTASANVDAMTGIAKAGWMFGKNNGGFWFGVDVAYIMPFGADVSIVAPGVPTTDPAYQDTQDAAEKFGESGYINITFARLGYIF